MRKLPPPLPSVWRHTIETPAQKRRAVRGKDGSTSACIKPHLPAVRGCAPPPAVCAGGCRESRSATAVRIYSLEHYQHALSSFQPGGISASIPADAARDEEQWTTLIPPRHDVMLEGFTLFTDWLVVEERQRGLTSLRQMYRKTGRWWGSLLTIRPMSPGLPIIRSPKRHGRATAIPP